LTKVQFSENVKAEQLKFELEFRLTSSLLLLIMTELSKSDIEKLNQIAAVLGNALAELEEIAARVEQPVADRKRRNLKEARKAELEYWLLTRRRTKKK